MLFIAQEEFDIFQGVENHLQLWKVNLSSIIEDGMSIGESL